MIGKCPGQCGSVAKFCPRQATVSLGHSQAAMPNSDLTKAAWATMSFPPIPFTCPFLIIARVSYPTRVRHAVRNLLKPRPDQPLYSPVILFHDVIEILDLPQFGEAPEPLVLLHVSHRLGIGGVLVDRNGARIDRVRPSQCFPEEALGGLGIAPGAEPEINGLAAAVDRPVQVAALDLDVGLVDPPRAVGRAQVGPQLLLQFYGIGLDSAVDGCVVHRYAAVPQHQLKIAVGDPNCRYQRTAHRITSP